MTLRTKFKDKRENSDKIIKFNGSEIILFLPLNKLYIIKKFDFMKLLFLYELCVLVKLGRHKIIRWCGLWIFE